MSCWRVLQLSEQPDSEHIPQLLVKPDFRANSYAVHVTCLSNIWSEELDVNGIVDRASQEQSPIEASKHDTAQLAILLENVRKPLEDADAGDAVCRIIRSDNDGITLHATISLPKPLDSLTWTFYLTRRTSMTLKNELIMPLLMTSHIQHERIASLVSAIKDRDRAITRLVDQYESSNLDLAAAFPVISGLKSGRKVIKREQAAKHVPALQPFREDAFKQETSHLVDSDVRTLGLFQQALSECTPDVPSQLKSRDGNGDLKWWDTLPNRLTQPKVTAKSKAKPVPVVNSPRPTKIVAASSDDETEDEFETHANFNTRNVPIEVPKAPSSSPPPKSRGPTSSDDDDLDAPPKSQGSQTASRKVTKSSARTKSPSPSSSPPKVVAPPAKSKVKGFRIGGKAKKAQADSPPPTEVVRDATPATDNEPPLPQQGADVEVTPNKVKRTFKIGGKGRTGQAGSSQVPQMTDRTRPTHSPNAQPASSPPPMPMKEGTSVVKEEHEETPEEKAERRRAELKRKTEEAAKKQAQTKKKRRF
ncbi:XLF-domain-containing protein [Setomelanomma holmii]|uniref:Non-homologous end-joining factor 1 n=1 Tax=Setomelanomma holmii TaxID=210430 RepID=A0A9P4LMA4_9PLEO|nr:XLF-domain-containing protein [Setomelanomma holmii]